MKKIIRLRPPSAPRRNYVHKAHFDARDDPWHWMHQRDDAELRAHIKKENEYAAQQMAPYQSLQDDLYREMLASIAEQDCSARCPRGEYEYYYRTHRDLSYPLYCRQHRTRRAAEEILLDQNQLAENLNYCALGVFSISPDHRILAYSVDENGDELYRLQFKRLAAPSDANDDAREAKNCDDFASHNLDSCIVENTCASLAWASDSRHVFYVTADETQRPYRVYRYRLGDDVACAELVYEETDATFYLSVERGLDGVYVYISLQSKSSSEVLALDAEQPCSSPRVVQKRVPGVEYQAAHHHGYFYVLTNCDAPNFKIMRTKVADDESLADEAAQRTWQTVVPHRQHVTLESFNLFAECMVLHERFDGLPHIRVRSYDGDNDRYVPCDEALYELWEERNEEFNTTVLRCGLSSLVTPHTVFDYDITSGARTIVKRTDVPGYDACDYQSQRLFARTADGARIPISLVYHKAHQDDAHRKPTPLLLLGYGAYGINYEVTFSRARLALLKRGVTVAIAHVRGGGECGRAWYENGRLQNKRNSFSDFICCAEYLVREGWTTPMQLAVHGASAGGLLVTAAINMRPQLCRAVVADVPFVDVLTTMLDDELPLSVTERDEWGDPQARAMYDYIKSYSPYDNIKNDAYPAMLITAGFNDVRVAYWEPLKYLARLRCCTTSVHPLLMRFYSAAGHGGPSGLHGKLRETAYSHAFLLSQLGLSSGDA